MHIFPIIQVHGKYIALQKALQIFREKPCIPVKMFSSDDVLPGSLYN